MRMKTSIITLNLLLVVAFFPFKADDSTLVINELKVKAPFEMPTIQVPDFGKCKKFVITDFGAEQGDKVKTSEAIAKAIDEANKIGGGTVVIPDGEWLTGQVHLKSNVNLYLSKEAVLLFSEKPGDYLPTVHSSWEGLECYNYSPLIYAYLCKNIAITGEGKVKAKMDIWKNWVTRPRGHLNSTKWLYNMAQENVPVEKRQMVNDSAHLRPQFIQINRCENVLLENFSILNSPFWTVHIYLSKSIVVRGLYIKANGRNNDGIDPEMTQNILIENVTFD
jgi:polygalacturonase